MSLRVTLIGAGNVASWFAFSITKQGGTIAQVYSRTMTHARELAQQYEAEPIDYIDRLDEHSDLYLFSLKDEVYETLLPQLPRQLKLAAHTAGSVSQHIFKGYAEHYGVIYPYQSLSKGICFDHLKVPLCIEGNDQSTEQQLLQWAKQWSDTTYLLNEEQRFQLHLAAVFASNFTNALYGIGYELLQEKQIDTSIMTPLLENTLKKIETMTPEEAQTGPAVRHDVKTMEKHLSMLSEEQGQNLYRIMSEIIRQKTASKQSQ